MDDIIRIGEPTPPERVGQKPGKGGNKMDYVTARFCMDRLDQSVGPQNWKNEYKEIGGHLICGVSVKCDGEWVTKWDVGTESNFEAEKGNFSDAFKRACVHWGIARDLYKEPKESFGSGQENEHGVVSKAAPDPDPIIKLEEMKELLVVDDWKSVEIHFGKNAGIPLGELKPNQLEWYQTKWSSKDPSDQDKILRKALDKSMKKGGTKDGFDFEK